MPPFLKNQKSKNKLQPQADQTNSEQAASSLRNLLSENLNLIKEKTEKNSGVVIRHFKIDVNNSLAAAIVYIEGIGDNQAIQDYLLQSLMKDNQKNDLNDQNALELISEDIVTIRNVSFADNWNDLLSSL
ncbi:spore germination protein [Priestia megaterium]|uniref:spore germination protein n=1 Tax=Priestia megaterium TaxID=1404 RepID=UPI002E22FD02|nr:spore germination protein [Priestia megaterium]MED3878251.1 spore germination protein [Priestia megaterium]